LAAPCHSCPSGGNAALADVGPLVGPGVTLEGMFGHAGARVAIVLNPALGTDQRAIDRALCHEMVHAYLFSIGDTTTNHGPAFQAVLQRLAGEGAFEGIAANAGEKAHLREWLESESARIDAERHEMDTIGAEITQDRADLDRDVATFNARAGAPADGGQSASALDGADLEARRQRFNQRVLDTNERLQRDRDDLVHFNSEVERYNLMMAYSDGLDEASTIKPKSPVAGGGR